MIETLQNYNPISSPQQTSRQKVLRMAANERMGGSVPVWDYAQSPGQSIASRLSNAQNPKTDLNTLAYQQEEPSKPPEEFSFGDLLDMINPLQHIPIVNHIYRELTGDTIKPISNIVGGAIFGGPVGVAAGLIDTIIQEETGQDATQNAIAFARSGKIPEFKNHIPEPTRTAGTQEIQYDPWTLPDPTNEAKSNILNELPGTVLALTDLSAKPETPKAAHQNTARYNS